MVNEGANLYIINESSYSFIREDHSKVEKVTNDTIGYYKAGHETKSILSCSSIYDLPEMILSNSIHVISFEESCIKNAQTLLSTINVGESGLLSIKYKDISISNDEGSRYLTFHFNKHRGSIELERSKDSLELGNLHDDDDWVIIPHQTLLPEILTKARNKIVILSNPYQTLEYIISDTLYFSRWMEKHTKAIQHLPLNRLCLVQSHNSGTFNMKSPFTKPWATTQHVDLIQQMRRGIRVLDIRLGCDGPIEWILVHDKWRTNLSLKQALFQVCTFIKSNPNEVIILDFHRFIELNHNFIWDNLFGFILEILRDILILYEGKLPTLEEIWQTKRRVVVAWNSNKGRVPSTFLRGIRQGWYQGARNKNELRDYIETDIRTRKSPALLWTIGACLPATFFSPVKPIPEVTKWFTPGNTWCNRANIIQVDFVVSFHMFCHVLSPMPTVIY